ncbi:MAG: thiamine phosphate synthase [Verrucomicrobiota bacterium]
MSDAKAGSKRLAKARLYGILDLGYIAEDSLERMAAQLCEGGVDIVQLRAKGRDECAIEEMANRVAPILRDAGVPFIINDFPELVPSIGADGAHVGQDDFSVADARWRAGRALAGEVPLPIIGKSTHSVEQAVAAAAEGADYIGFGPLFPTPTKAGRAAIGMGDIARVHELVSVPIFCIGGIKLENLAEVIAAGAQRVVIVSGILQARDVAAYCREAKARLDE